MYRRSGQDSIKSSSRNTQLEAIIICDTLPEERGVNTDHLPIVTVVDVELTKAPAQIAKNFRDVDWKDFRATLEGKMAKIGIPSRIKSHSELNRYV
jgi:hypothetical protein